MSIGSHIRACLGPLEPPVTDLYRRLFFEIGRLVRPIRNWAPARRILEVGCGEGALIDKLAAAYPEAHLTGIDITPRVGRLFQGDRDRVVFAQTTVQEFAAAHPATFDLVVVCDVLHHVPWEMHEGFLRDVQRTLRPGGRFVLKDWEKQENLIHLLGYLSDRYLTGDRIRYGTAGDFRRLLDHVFGPRCVERELRLPPWPNNLAFFVHPEPHEVSA